MGRINESWGPGVDGLRDDNPLNGALMNLDDVRKTLDEGVSSKSYELFDGLYLSLNQGNIDRYDAQTFFEIAPDDAKGYPA